MLSSQSLFPPCCKGECAVNQRECAAMLIVCVRSDSDVIKTMSGQGRTEFKLLWVTKMNLILLLHHDFLELLHLL